MFASETESVLTVKFEVMNRQKILERGFISTHARFFAAGACGVDISSHSRMATAVSISMHPATAGGALTVPCAYAASKPI